MSCEKCNDKFFLREFDASATSDADELDVPFPTLIRGAQLFAEYNQTEALRTCGKCGHCNRPFPLTAWGWDRYARQSETASRGKADLVAAASQAAPDHGGRPPKTSASGDRP